LGFHAAPEQQGATSRDERSRRHDTQEQLLEIYLRAVSLLSASETSFCEPNGEVKAATWHWFAISPCDQDCAVDGNGCDRPHSEWNLPFAKVVGREAPPLS
jgi:hypothetical protein